MGHESLDKQREKTRNLQSNFQLRLIDTQTKLTESIKNMSKQLAWGLFVSCFDFLSSMDNHSDRGDLLNSGVKYIYFEGTLEHLLFFFHLWRFKI